MPSAVTCFLNDGSQPVEIELEIAKTSAPEQRAWLLEGAELPQMVSSGNPHLRLRLFLTMDTGVICNCVQTGADRSEQKAMATIAGVQAIA